jgi:predicted phosphoribosyltransferase
MQLIFKRDVAQELKDKYTILELESIPVEGQMLEAFCLVPAEKIIGEMSTLQYNIALHEDFVRAIKDNNVEECLSIATQLKGNFGGELDTFYEVIVDRCNATGSTRFLVPPIIP